MLTLTERRLHNQQLDQTRFDSPAGIVGWLGAVQSQEYPGAKWSLAMRLRGVTDAELDQTFAEGSILRTHVMRPTWHFVTREDIRWMVELTAPKVRALNQRRYHQLELDAALLNRCADLIAGALRGGNQLTRQELAALLALHGVITEGQRMPFILHHAELEGLICSGALRGKQMTYALMEERAPKAIRLGRDESLAELARRYFTSHAPATVSDFSWWSGLAMGDVRRAVELAGSLLTSDVIDGKTYWHSMDYAPVSAPTPRAHLLPTYDEYIIGYQDRTTLLDAPPDERAATIRKLNFDSMFLIDGRIAGTWKRTFKKGAVIVETRPLKPLPDEHAALLADAAQRYGDFLGMTAVLVSESGQEMTRRHLKL